MSSPVPRPGDVVWRIGKTAPLKCIVVRVDRDGCLATRASTFARNTNVIAATDIFPDRAACRVEIQRRAEVEEQTR